MVQALLIGGEAAHTRLELGSRVQQTITLPMARGIYSNYHYVGNLALPPAQVLRLYRHESVRPQDIESCVQVSRPPACRTEGEEMPMGQPLTTDLDQPASTPWNS